MEWRQDGHRVLSEPRSFSGSVLLRRMAHSFKPLSEEGCRALPIADSAQNDYRFALPIAAHHIPDSALRCRYAICQFSRNLSRSMNWLAINRVGYRTTSQIRK